MDGGDMSAERPLLVLATAAPPPSGDKRPWRHSVWVLVPSIVLIVLAYVFCIPTLTPYLVQAYTDCKVGEDGCKGNYSEMQEIKTVSDTVRALISVFAAPLLGRLSDTYGRKPVLIFVSVAQFMPFVCLLAFTDVVPYFVVYSLSGVSGATSLSSFAMQLVVADWYPAEERAETMGLLFAGATLAIVFTPLFTLELAKAQGYSPKLSFLICAILAAINVVYTAVAIPESLRRENRCALSPRRGEVRAPASCAATASATCGTQAPLRLLRRSPLMRAICVVTVLVSLPELGLIEIAIAYADDSLDLDKGDSVAYNSYLLLCAGAVAVFTLSYGLTWLKARYDEATICYISTAGNMAHFALWAALSIWPLRWIGYVAEFVAGLTFLAFPVLAAIASNQLSESEQGVGIGVLNGMKNICGVIGPPFFGITYAYFREGRHVGGYNLPSFPFLFSLVVEFFTLWYIGNRLVPRFRQSEGLGRDHEAACAKQ